MTTGPMNPERRRALACLAHGGAGTVFLLAGGVLTPFDLSTAGAPATTAGRPFLVQLSDSHIGFHKAANPDVDGTLTQAVNLIRSLPMSPRLLLHTGDLTHLSRPEEFERAAGLLAGVGSIPMHIVPGEHDVADETASEFFRHYGQASAGRGYYSFDHDGVHFLALNNVMQARDGGLGGLGEEQVAWARADLKGRGASTPIVVFAHMPLWSIYPAWGWGTADSGPILAELRRFGSATVLNGHIHQVISKVEGHVTFHTAASTAFPQPAPGEGPGPGPLVVPADQLTRVLGVTRVTIQRAGARLDEEHLAGMA